MPRIAVSNDDRRPTQVEHLAAGDLDSEQFRRRLIERLRRALRDATPQTDSALAATSSRRRDRYPQAMVHRRARGRPEASRAAVSCPPKSATADGSGSPAPAAGQGVRPAT